MTHTYQTKGTCSKQITFDLNDGVVSNVSYLGGCNGNLQGVAKLVEGQKAEDLIAKLKGIQCGLKGTSCPDQLARALEDAIAGRI
ncbi:MAG: TIGR03905 family TSCPD domain-containing protein [Lachnospiraceae bacterium]|nr:TIGR03905 family TSCPD domain-containing protein [Lachnospiraceae bacterium]